MLSALAIFVGGFAREAAEAVADADLGVLAALMERSLIQRLPDARGGSRYQVHELVRSYALRHLEDDGQIRGRHFGYFLELVESLETSWNTQLEPLWSNPIRADLANVSAAMMWVLDQGDAEGALRTGGWRSTGSGPSLSPRPPSAWRGWKRRWTCPGRRRVVIGIRARAKAYFFAGLLKTRADPAAALGLLEQGLMLFEEIGDEAGVAMCVQHLGAANLLTGDPERARREIAESLVRSQACGDVLGVAWCYDLLGIAAFVLGDYTEASSHLLESATQFESLDAPLGACHALVDLGLTRRLEGKLSAALNAYRNAVRYQRDYRFTTESPDTLDGLAVDRGRANPSIWPRSCSARLRDGGRPISRNSGSRCPTTSRSRPPASAAASASEPGSRRTRPGGS